MASPPASSATSPPGPPSLALPKQRPTLALPGQLKSRKPSLASTTTTSSAHPLRQTSFPPPESLEAQHAAALTAYSPSQSSPPGSLLDDADISETEIQSAISGPAEESAGRKRKRGEKRPRGRPARQSVRTGSVSLVNGEDGTQRGAPSVVTADNNAAEDEEEEDDDEEAALNGRSLYESGQLDASEHEKDSLHKSTFRKYMDVVDALPLDEAERGGMSVKDMGERYDVWNRAKLRTGDLRRLVNQTLSQSVPANVVTVVNSYTKMFAGMLVEEAREVQAEWMAMEAERADGEENVAFKRLKRTYERGGVDGDETTRPNTREGNDKANGVKNEAFSSPTNPTSTQTQSDTATHDPSSTTLHSTQPPDDSLPPLYPGGAGGLSTSISECDRGPLLPDHLREALRRYKKARKGGTVGFTGLSLEGREVAASRMGGRRLFR